MRLYSYKPRIGAPDVPRNVTITSVTDTTITISWTANTESDFSSYNLYKSTDGVTYGLPYISGLTSTTYQDTGLTSSTLYYYKVTCEDTSGNESGFSSVVSQETTASPSGLTWIPDQNPLPVPLPAFTYGTPGTFNFDPYISGTPGSITVETGALPPNVTIVGQTLSYDGGGSSSGHTETGVSFRLNTSAQDDWQTRISGAGVVWYHTFDTDDEVNNFRWTDQVAGGNDPLDIGQTGMCVRDPTGGVDGGGALRLRYRIGTTPYQAPAWLRPFSPLAGGTTTGNGRGEDDPGAGILTPRTGWNPRTNSSIASQWIHGFYGHQTYADADPDHFDGYEYYLQYRIKFSSSRFQSGTPSAGKTLYLDTPDGSQQEIVIQNNYSYGPVAWWGAYRSFSPPISGPGGARQYGSDWPNCGILDPVSTYCWFYGPDEWITYLLHVRLGLDGASTTLLDAKFAEPGDTAYRQIGYFDDIPMPYSVGQRKGHNCVKASNYMNGATTTSEWYQWYDQIIFSRNPIPCPQV